MVWLPRIRRVHSARASDADNQVCNLSRHSNARVDPCERCARIYAVTLGSVRVAIVFAAVTVSQLALGICLTTLVVRSKCEVEFSVYPEHNSRSRPHRRHDLSCAVPVLPPIPLDAYHVCPVGGHRQVEIAATTFALLYGARESLEI